jgi:hypothetical protein
MSIKDSDHDGSKNEALAGGEITALAERPDANVGSATADPPLTVTESIMAAIKMRSNANTVPILAMETGGNDLAIARDYLLQHQERSVRELAEHSFARAAVEPRVVEAATERLRIGRTTGPRHGFEDLLRNHCFLIEQECTNLKIPLHGGVACGVGWSPLRGPAQKPVLTTDASMIIIPESALMLCHFFCKLLARSFLVKDTATGIAVNYGADEVIGRIRANKRLRRYAAGFLGFCASSNRRCLNRLKNATGLARSVWTNLLLSTEIFVIAHEYGHHIALHRAGDTLEFDGAPDDRMKVDELEADHLAALITGHFGARFQIPVAHSGAAGVVALVGTDMLRRARSVLATGYVQSSDSKTHPPLEHRLVMLETLRYDPRNVDGVRLMRQNFRDIMEGIWELVLPDLQKLYANGIRPAAASVRDSQWLPFWG